MTNICFCNVDDNTIWTIFIVAESLQSKSQPNRFAGPCGFQIMAWFKYEPLLIWDNRKVYLWPPRINSELGPGFNELWVKAERVAQVRLGISDSWFFMSLRAGLYLIEKHQPGTLYSLWHTVSPNYTEHHPKWNHCLSCLQRLAGLVWNSVSVVAQSTGLSVAFHSLWSRRDNQLSNGQIVYSNCRYHVPL